MAHVVTPTRSGEGCRWRRPVPEEPTGRTRRSPSSSQRVDQFASRPSSQGLSGTPAERPSRGARRVVASARHGRVTVPCVLRLHDTATGEVSELKLRDPGEVSMYVCGPTVYDAPHLGHGRFALVFDVLRRYLIFSGLEVTYVSNITDIDDQRDRAGGRAGRRNRRADCPLRGAVVGGDGLAGRAPARRGAPRHRLRGPNGRGHRGAGV